MAVDVCARIARDPKKMERFYARGLQLARKTQGQPGAFADLP
jgi:hypothetical protein